MSPELELAIPDLSQPGALPSFPYVYKTLVNGTWEADQKIRETEHICTPTLQDQFQHLHRR